MAFPFETSPFYQRPFLIAWTFIHNLFTVIVFAVIPIMAALAIILGIIFIIVVIVAGLLHWEPGSTEVKAGRKREREERERERAEGKMSDVEQIGSVSSVEVGVSGGSGSIGEIGAIAALDTKTRLEIEIELLAEMVAVRRGRLEALEKMK
jgi:hypothetical protein